MSPLFSRRTAALVAAPVLALGGLAALPAAPASAASAAVDPAPLAHGVTWLTSQLTGGVLHNDQYDFDDLGLTVDAGLALADLGKTAAVDTISSALAPQVASYYTYDVNRYDNAGNPTFVGTHVSAGSLAKAAVFAQAAGDNPAAYGEHDLITELQDRVADAGRLGDVFFPEEQFEADYSNTIGQSFAVQALDTAGSSVTASATDFLLAQQCSAGYFRLDLGADLASTCDAGSGVANTDATALAVLNLLGQRGDDVAVDAAIDDALAWLQSTQAANGSWGSEAPTTAANANSTGLAGWALGDAGQTGPATAAAVWLRRHQADDFGPCTTGLTGATGAIAYDDASLVAGRSGGIVVESQDSFRRASTQALPALQWAPAGLYASEPTSTSGFVRAGSRQKIQADAVAPGQTVCFARGASQDLVNADATGRAVGTVKLPAGSGTRRYSVGLTSGVLGKVTFRALAAKKLPVTLKKQKVAKRGSQVVTVKGLAKAEKVSVFFHGAKVASGKAKARGTFTARFTVGKKAGKSQVRVVGQFANRRATKTFKVTQG